MTDQKYSNNYLAGWLNTEAGTVPIVSTELTGKDSRGAFKARWSFNRMNYKVDPGLYAVGRPGPDSLVLVSANYKLSFDVLCRELRGLDAWILVLDTRGINVWCAADKGTFGTAEIVNRIEKEGEDYRPRCLYGMRSLCPELPGGGD